MIRGMYSHLNIFFFSFSFSSSFLKKYTPNEDNEIRECFAKNIRFERNSRVSIWESTVWITLWITLLISSSNFIFIVSLNFSNFKSLIWRVYTQLLSIKALTINVLFLVWANECEWQDVNVHYIQYLCIFLNLPKIYGNVDSVHETYNTSLFHQLTNFFWLSSRLKSLLHCHIKDHEDNIVKARVFLMFSLTLVSFFLFW